MTTATALAPVMLDTHKRARTSHLQWVRISEITACPRAQREFRPAWAAELAAHFDLEGLGYLVVNRRNGYTYCIDGQHRIAALKKIGFADDTVQCEVYEGLSEREEARMFLRRNNKKTVAAFDKFAVAVAGEFEEPTAIQRLMGAQGIAISRRGGVSCTTALQKAFRRQHEAGFSKTIRVIRDAYGDVGFTANVVDGISLFLHRYDGQVDEALAIARLGGIHAGVNGLVGLAKKEQSSNRQPLTQCIAATAATIYNRQARGNSKLAPWWKS